MFKFNSTHLAGSKILTLPQFLDDRGVFVKTFQDSLLREQGIEFNLMESYFSVSKRDVIRGMHFQLPPHQHSKIVFCPHGAILDVLVDLRKDSETYGQYTAQELSADNHRAFYIPEGFAHGFKALTEGAITYYLVSSEHNKESDAGIRYDSIGLDWNLPNPIISVRDQSFVALSDLESPF